MTAWFVGAGQGHDQPPPAHRTPLLSMGASHCSAFVASLLRTAPHCPRSIASLPLLLLPAATRALQYSPLPQGSVVSPLLTLPPSSGNKGAHINLIELATPERQK